LNAIFFGKGGNLLITGPTGVIKSFIASAIGHQACMKVYRVLYFNIQKLFPQLRMLKADGSYLKVSVLGNPYCTIGIRPIS